MKSINTGYKFIAIVSLSYALFSCSSTVESQSNSELLAKLNAIEAKIDTLTGKVDAVQTTVLTTSAPAGKCSLQEVIDQNYANCDPGMIPEDVAATTTYCIAQERSGEIGAQYAVGLNTDIDLGAGWPNVVWGKVTAKLETPVPSPLAVPYPNEVAASGSMSLGRGLEICVDIPIVELEPDQIAQIHDLVRGVNEGQGTYSRRTGRLLNYAARRTPIAVVSKASVSANSKVATEDADNAFDVADAAIEKLLAGDFQPISSGSQMFSDPVFQDLVSALELPTPVVDTIFDPERTFDALKIIRQSEMADVCNTMGISATSVARSPALANQCARFGIYPNIQAQWDAAGFVRQARDRVNQMYTASGIRSFMCGNIALAIFSPDC
jgi:hypothetical protein